MHKKSLILIIQQLKGQKCEGLHFLLQTIQYKALISHVIDSFKGIDKIVVLAREFPEDLKIYLNCAYSQTCSLYFLPLHCNLVEEIPSLKNESFYLCSSNLYFNEFIPDEESNWVYFSRQRHFFLESDKENLQEFRGVLFVSDPNIFWREVNMFQNILEGMTKGFISLKKINTYDIDSDAAYQDLKKQIEVNMFDFSKKRERIFLTEHKVVKWYGDSEIVQKRFSRAKKLKPYVPEITHVQENFYAYNRIPGKTLYHCLGALKEEDLFQWLEERIWRPIPKDSIHFNSFLDAANKFYYKKTKERLRNALKDLNLKDKKRIINQTASPSLEDLLQRIDWTYLTQTSIPCHFHGDLQFDNILLAETGDEPFMLIDWRQDFSGLSYGDLYYDLAKLNSGLYLNYAKIKESREFDVILNFDQTDVKLYHVTCSRLQEIQEKFQNYCFQNDYHWKKVELLTALIYLNMSPLHCAPLNLFLLMYGQWMLSKAV